MTDRTHKRSRKGGTGEPPDDDQALWSHVARQVKRPQGMKRRVPAVETMAMPVPVRRHEASTPRRSVDRTEPRAEVRDPSPRPLHREPPALAKFDTKKARRIAAGRVEIDARIDLHGLRQDEAHAALVGFLISAHARGHRIVLVITGKGGPPQRDSVHGDPWGRERGVLKRNVPRWLEEPELRRIVVSHTTAAQRHGGEGALYIHLRAIGR
jgi:DNA-nicking Smr family endonuclease